MGLFERILDSECADSPEYCSWEQYIRALALDNGMTHANTDAIYPIMGYDERIMDEAIVVGFAVIPFFQDETKHFCGMFFDYDGVEEFEEIGPGRVLSNLVLKIRRETEALGVDQKKINGNRKNRLENALS